MKIGRHRSMVTKIVVAACGMVALLLLIGSVMLVTLEIQREQSVFETYRAEIRRSIKEREQEERTLLHKNVSFNVEILSRVIAG